MIKIKASAVDGAGETRAFVDLSRARRFAQDRVGATPEIGCYYAVAADGIVKVEWWGCSAADLFPALLTSPAEQLKPYQVWVASVNEDTGRTTWTCIADFDSYVLAAQTLNGELVNGYDGVELRGGDDEAREHIAEVAARSRF